VVKYRAPFVPCQLCYECDALEVCEYVDNAPGRGFIQPESDGCIIVKILARREMMLG